jgi:hypothetical protein
MKIYRLVFFFSIVIMFTSSIRAQDQQTNNGIGENRPTPTFVRGIVTSFNGTVLQLLNGGVAIDISRAQFVKGDPS